MKRSSEEPDEKKRVRKIDISPLFEDNLIKSGFSFLRNYSFKAASDEFLELRDKTSDYERAEVADLLGDLSLVCAKWDNFDYERALSCLNETMDRKKTLLRIEKFKTIKDSISNQQNVLNKMKDRVLKESLIDLYQNAERKCEQGQNIDCVLRAYSVYEKILVYKALEIIKKEAGFLPDSVRFQDSVKDEIKTNNRLNDLLIKCFGNIDYNIPYSLGRSEALGILKSCDTKFGLDYYRVRIDELSSLRNAAVHNMVYIDDENVKRSLYNSLTILKAHFGENVEKQVWEFPFAKNNLEKIWMQFEKII